MNPLSFGVEFFTQVLSKEEETHFGFFNPYGNPFVLDPKVPPTHYTTEGGGTYSARPDLSRAGGPGIYYAGAGLAGAGLLIATTEGITTSYGAIIQDKSEQEQQSLWRAFAQSLVGGFGAGSWSY